MHTAKTKHILVRISPQYDAAIKEYLHKMGLQRRDTGRWIRECLAREMGRDDLLESANLEATAKTLKKRSSYRP